MIALLAALSLQASPESTEAIPPLTASDPCIQLQGRGAALIGDQSFRGRDLGRAVAQRLPAGRPLFIHFANDRARSDIEGMSLVMSGGRAASEVVIVETCELPVSTAQVAPERDDQSYLPVVLMADGSLSYEGAPIELEALLARAEGRQIQLSSEPGEASAIQVADRSNTLKALMETDLDLVVIGSEAPQ